MDIWRKIFPDRFRGYAFIIGSMKSGTTSLHNLLAQHPRIAASLVKEPNYLQKNEIIAPADFEASVFGEIDKRKKAYTLESSTNYSKNPFMPGVAARIAALPGDTRLVYIMRNPIDRIYSHMAHRAALKWDPLDASNTRLVDVSRYAMQLDEYERAGMRDRILLLDFDDLIADPVATANKVFAFLRLRRAKVDPEVRKNQRRQKSVDPLTDEERARYAEVLRPDVQRLIEHYGFEPARKWGIA